MCTLTMIDRLADGSRGLRVVVNRDESRERPLAIPPAWHRAGACPDCGTEEARALWPTDPAGGGTWISVNEHGLVLALLNMNPMPRPASPEGAISRGVLIPRFASCREPGHVIERVFRTDLSRFAPFRLVAARASTTGVEIFQAWWDRAAAGRAQVDIADACFVSSGMGDDKVLARIGLFRQMMSGEGGAPAQDRYHAHVWPTSPQTSVMMSRDDARTVSVTTVEAPQYVAGQAPRVTMDYWPVPAEARVGVVVGAGFRAARMPDAGERA